MEVVGNGKDKVTTDVGSHEEEEFVPLKPLLSMKLVGGIWC